MKRQTYTWRVERCRILEDLVTVLLRVGGFGVALVGLVWIVHRLFIR